MRKLEVDNEKVQIDNTQWPFWATIPLLAVFAPAEMNWASRRIYNMYKRAILYVLYWLILHVCGYLNTVWSKQHLLDLVCNLWHHKLLVPPPLVIISTGSIRFLTGQNGCGFLFFN